MRAERKNYRYLSARKGTSRNLLLSLLIPLILFSPAHANTWHVGPLQTYTLPSQVGLLVSDGDTIYIDGGVYANDATKWIRRDLKIIGLGTGSNRTILRYTGNIPNHKGIFVFETPGTCDNASVENIVFDGAQVSDADGANGAGIRFQANNLTVKYCKFVNCQNGILEGNGSVNTSNIGILNCEFENNGYQLPNDPSYSGYAHHIYISASADSLIVMNNWFHRPRGQANSIKTRAQRNFILYNFIDEEPTGYGSWEINIAQGGLTIVVGNIIVQSTSGANHGIVGYDASTNPLEDFYFVNNTVINQFNGNISYFNTVPAAGINTFRVYNNIFASNPGASETIFSGNLPGGLDTSHNSFSGDYLAFGFTDPSMSDFTLTANAVSAIDMGVYAGTTNTAYQLDPGFMYQSFTASLLPRTILGGAIDIGAYEYDPPATLSEYEHENEVSIFPNPTPGKCRMQFYDGRFDRAALEIFDACGKTVYTGTVTGRATEVDLSSVKRGIYFVRIPASNEILYGKIILQ